MVAIFVAGGESLTPKEQTRRRVRKCGRILGEQDLVIRLGPLYGAIICTFFAGLLESACRAQIRIRVPFGYEIGEDLRALLEQYPSERRDVDIVHVEYGHRNEDLLRDSPDAAVFLNGGIGTSHEIGRALDINNPPIKRIIVLDGEGLAAENLRRVPRFLSRVELIGLREDPETFLSGLGENTSVEPAELAQGC